MQLTVVSGTDSGKALALGPGASLRVGRGREADLVLHDAKASRAHAELTVQQDGRVVLADLGSSNGTWVNGHRLDRPVLLSGGERLWIGDTVIDVTADAPAAPSTGGVQVTRAGPADSGLRRAASSVGNAILLRPPPGPQSVPSVAATERQISTALKVSGVLVCGGLGVIMLAIIGLLSGDFAAFLAGLFFAFLAVPVYLALVLWLDRNEREPGWLIALTFMWGAGVSVFIAFWVNSIGSAIVAGGFGEGVGEFYGGSISAPIVEECAKGFVLFLIYKRFRGEFNGKLDGVIYAAVVALGFAATENVLYYSQGFMEDFDDGNFSDLDEGEGVVIGRGLISPFSHPLFTSLIGIGFGVASQSTSRSRRFWAPVLGLLGAIALHSLWNTSLFAAGGLPAEIGALLILVVALFFLGYFVFMLVFINRQLKNERQTIGQYLQYDVQEGRLTQGEVGVLVNGKLRRRAVKEAKRKGGKPGRDLRKAFHQATSELAFLRERIARGLLPWDARGAELHTHRQAEVVDLRERLGPLAYVPESAFGAGVPAAGEFRAPAPAQGPPVAPPPPPPPPTAQPPALPQPAQQWWRQ